MPSQIERKTSPDDICTLMASITSVVALRIQIHGITHGIFTTRSGRSARVLTIVENQPGYHSIIPAASAKFKGWSEQPDLVLNEIIERFGNNVTVVCNERAAKKLSFSLQEPQQMGICQSGRYFDLQGNSARLYALTAPGKKIMNNYLIGQKLALLPAA